MTYTDQELNDFMIQPDLEFSESDTKISIKSNIYLLSRNFVNLFTYLSKLKAYVNKIDNNLPTRTSIKVSKIIILIVNSINISESYQIVVDEITYKVERLNQYVVEITNITTPAWITDDLMVQIKTVNGIIVYPVITTIDNKIKIDFIDGLKIEYNVYII
jgi:hypothetical protein